VTHYDRDADVAAFNLEEYDGRRAAGELRPWGVLLRDSVSRQVVSVELHEASTRLPRDLLEVLPAPGANGVTIERSPA
jgi:hypothetical protein